MLYTGLTSVTFRQLEPERIVPLASQAGLDAIEWGGDIHVPHGDAKCAKAVGQLTRDYGLSVSSYGSYYKVGVSNDFTAVLESAIALGAPTIRIWAGDRATKDADQAFWHQVVEDTIDASDAAKQAGIRLSFEFHQGTLVDGSEQAFQLLQDVKRDNVSLYWQPEPQWSIEKNLQTLTAFAPCLNHLHVFHWNSQRLPLQDGREPWLRYLTQASQVEGERVAILEFVRNNDPQQFLHDAAVLKALIEAAC